MTISQAESHDISVLAGRGDTIKLPQAVTVLARREDANPGAVLLACRDDYHQTAAHMAAKSGQTGSIHALARLFSDDARRAEYFNVPNRFSGDRPVHTAMRHGHIEAFKALVQHGADPTASNRFGDVVVDYEGDFAADEVRAVLEAYRARVAGGGQ